MKELVKITGQNIKDIHTLYSKIIDDDIKASEPLYSIKGVKFNSLSNNDYAKKLIENWVKQTSETMINLSRSKSLGFIDINGNFSPLKESYQKVIDTAVMNVTTGVDDFYSAMRTTIKSLGGSGVKSKYVSESGKEIYVRLDSVIRQNILYGAKQAHQSYQDHISKEIGCDGFEVEYHSNSRPSHEFMGGRIFSNYGDKKINGVFYPDGTTALARLQDYGCLHKKVGVILGISQPTYSEEELKELKDKDNELIEYDGQSMAGYEWKQVQRQLERSIRQQKDIANIAKSSGDTFLYNQSKNNVKILRNEYFKLTKATGLQSTPERMTVFK